MASDELGTENGESLNPIEAHNSRSSVVRFSQELAIIEQRRRLDPTLPRIPPTPTTKIEKRIAEVARYVRIARYKPRKQERWKIWLVKFKKWRSYQPPLDINGIIYRPHRKKGYYISNYVSVAGAPPKRHIIKVRT